MGDYSKDLVARRRFRGRLEAIMQKRQINQTGLSKQSGLSSMAISNYLRGRAMPSESSLARLAIVLAIPADWLIGTVDDPQTDNAKLSRPAKVELIPPGMIAKFQMHGPVHEAIPLEDTLEYFHACPEGQWRDTGLWLDCLMTPLKDWVNFDAGHSALKQPSRGQQKLIANRIKARCEYLGCIDPTTELIVVTRFKSSQYVRGILNGEKYPGPEGLYRIALALKWSVNILEEGIQSSVAAMATPGGKAYRTAHPEVDKIEHNDVLPVGQDWQTRMDFFDAKAKDVWKLLQESPDAFHAAFQHWAKLWDIPELSGVVTPDGVQHAPEIDARQAFVTSLEFQGINFKWDD